MSKPKRDYEIGYGQPPSHSQFKEGQSGNRKGRPPKKGKPELPALDLTRTYIQREGRRMITIREGGKAKAVPVVEAVMHALSIKAMQGSILAQRTLLEYQLKEDARVRAEKEEKFKFWREYVRDTTETFTKAEARGEPLPKIYPHPSDIEFDFFNLECKFLGPLNAQEAANCQHRLDLANFLYELIIFSDETAIGAPSDEQPIFGIFMFTYLNVLRSLPPRMRTMDKNQNEAMERRVMLGRRRWEAYIEQRSKELGMPIDPRKIKARHIDLRDINLRFVDGEFVDYRWPRSKRRNPGVEDG